jgi:hypothetical protein
MLCVPWIEPLLGHKLISPKDLRLKQGFFLHLFREKKPKGKFILSPTTKVVGYFTLKKYRTRKNVETIEEQEKKSKRKNIEAKEKVYSLN